jgi:TM2 domain-containing membrane protein YozV
MAEFGKKSADEKFCSECGQIINAKAEICPKCGVRQFEAPSGLAAIAPNGKSKLAAALFALFLGGLGIHKFYLGRVGWGIVYLLLCWTFIPALVGLIEGILLLVMSESDFNRKYGGSTQRETGPPRN